MGGAVGWTVAATPSSHRVMRVPGETGNTAVTEQPLISVIIVNLDGRHLLADCLNSIFAQEYPQERIEVIVVDNGSTDDSVPFVRQAFPQVRVIEAGRNLGFAGGNNLGARHSSGDCLALINNDAQADPLWLQAMVDLLDPASQAVCVAAKILDKDGQTIDFVDTGLTLYGRAFQIDEGMPASHARGDEPKEILAPCGGGMLIRRDVFWQVGGFDEDYVAYYEDVDLGWRLWLHGYRVLYAPDAVVYHRQHSTGLSFPEEQRQALSEANALRTLFKNLEEANLWQVLSFGLFMGVTRSLEQAQVDRQPYQFGFPPTGDARPGQLQPGRHLTPVAISSLVAIAQVGEEIEVLQAKRRLVQKARVRSDEQIFSRFPIQAWNPLFLWRRYNVIQGKLARDMRIDETLQPRLGSRLLIITHETIGPKMAGPGIRAWEMACALSDRFDVLLAAPGNPTRSHDRVQVVGYEMSGPDFSGLRSAVANTDIILAMGPLLAKLPVLRDLGKPTIVDLYDPFELEKLAQSPAVTEEHHVDIDLESKSALALQASVGDFFVCASERQRDFWMGVLLAEGRINTVTYAQDPSLRALIDVVPFGIPATPPQKERQVLKGIHPGIAEDDLLLLWNGGLWQWFDPLTVLDALILVLEKRRDVKLFFAAGKHFDSGTVSEMPIYAQVSDRCQELGLLDRHVFFGDWIPYDERGDYLLEADLAISAHQATIESHFASRTRLLDCVWAGLPVLATAGDPLSDMIAQSDLGRTVAPEQPELMAAAILDMLDDPELRNRVDRKAQAIRNEYTWTRAVEPIAGFMERAAFAPDALEASIKAGEVRQTDYERERLRRRISDLEAHIDEVRQGRVMRLLQAVNMALGRE